MSTASPQSERRPIWQSPRFQARAFWLAFVVFVGGVIVFAGVHWASSGTRDAPLRNVPPKDVSQVPKTVTLSGGAMSVTRQFIVTAVARKDLRTAWGISGPHIRQGSTLKEWLTGNIAVVPYPADSIDVARMKVDYSYKDRAQIEVVLLPKPGEKIRAQIFVVTLIKIGPSGHRHWVVDGWVPRTGVPLPSSGE